MAEAVANWYTSDVARCGVVLVGREGPGLARRVRVRELDVHVRRDAARGQDIAEGQRMATHRVGAVQHGHELVDAAHAGPVP